MEDTQTTNNFDLLLKAWDRLHTSREFRGKQIWTRMWRSGPKQRIQRVRGEPSKASSRQKWARKRGWQQHPSESKTLELETSTPRQCGSLNHRRRSWSCERREKHTEVRGGRIHWPLTRPTRVYLYVFRRQVLYCRTVRMNHEGESRGQNVASTKLLQNRENRSMKENQE
jgi:hypothetical protein